METTLTKLATFANAADGIAAEVYSDNHRFPEYRVVFRDTDAEETIAVIRGYTTQAAAEAKAKTLVG